MTPRSPTHYQLGNSPRASDDISFGDIQSFLSRRRRIILSSFIFFLILATLYCLIATRRYGAVGEIEIQKSEISSLDSLGGAEAGAGGAATADSLDFTLTEQTQVNIIKSDTLILQVIRELDLEPSHDFFPQDKEGFHIPEWIKFWSKPIEPLSVPLENAPNRRALALERFNKRLKVKMVAGTRLIDITYYNPDPKLAADVVNHLMAAYVDFAFEARFQQTQQASQWLSNQLNSLKKQTEDLQNKAIKLQRETGLFGEDEAHNVVLSRLEALNAEVTAAESNRILKEAIYKAVQDGNGEMISGLNGNSLSGTVAPNQNSLALIQNLRGQEATVRAQLADFQIRYGADHPKIIQLRAQLADIQQAIKQEDQRIADRAKSDYEIALQQENISRKNLETQKKTANELNDKATAYVLAKKEADDSRNLYGNLLDKLKQAGVLQGLKASNVVIVDPGRTPPPNDPDRPALLLIYALALVAGAFVGAIVALVLNAQEERFFTPMKGLPGVWLMGVLPDETMEHGTFVQRFRRMVGFTPTPVDSDGGLLELNDVVPEFVEGLLALRTSVMIPRDGPVPKVIVTTSPVYGEGKSLVSANLAAVLAQTGSKTLSVDADLRKGVWSGTSSTPGLTDLLTAKELSAARATSEVRPNLFVMNSGSVKLSSPPPDWLSSGRMRELISKWRGEYDFVVINVPPVLPVTDAIIVSQFADLVLLAGRQYKTTTQVMERACLRLKDELPTDSKLGAVITGVPVDSPDYVEFYGYKGAANPFVEESGVHA